ncbi:hypothetical protein N665_0489s0010 [Sinapis alba]|nr:hypothetical protein N665_0489s0010 [Sinapis alba]
MDDSASSASQGVATTPGGIKGSWVGAVQGQKVLKKYDVEVTMKDGIGSEIVPEEITKDVEPLWDDFLIGKFLDNAPHVAKIHAIVNKIWALNDKAQMIDVFEVNTTTMKFRIMNSSVRNRILRRGMWNMAGIPVVMTKWSPVVEKQKPEAQSIPMWVHLKNVPMNMFSWQGLSFVASPVGSPVRLHPETAQCLILTVAKIFVKADLTKSMNFNIQGQDTLVEYFYPWLPTKYSTCGKWGHSVKVCPLNRGKQQTTTEVTPLVGEHIEKVGEEGMEVVAQSLEIAGTGKIISTSEDRERGEEVTESLRNGSETEKIQDHEEIEKVGEEGSGIEETVPPAQNVVAQTDKVVQDENLESTQEWLNVTPGKSSKSPRKTLEFGNVSILTNSRFSVLSPTEEEGEILEEKDGEDTAKVSDLQELSTEKSTKVKEIVIPRQSLPRGSKSNHKFLGDTSVQTAQDDGPSDLNKKKSRRNQ